MDFQTAFIEMSQITSDKNVKMHFISMLRKKAV